MKDERIKIEEIDGDFICHYDKKKDSIKIEKSICYGDDKYKGIIEIGTFDEACRILNILKALCKNAKTKTTKTK